MSTKQQWSVFRVYTHIGEKALKHGQIRLGAIPSEFLDRGSKVRVLRNGKLLDKGKVEEMGGHNVSLQFSGLDVIVPPEEKRYRKLPMATGGTHWLLPKWFEEGDIIRVQVASSRFRACVRVAPWWKKKSW